MSIIFQPYKWEYYETDELEIYIYGLTEDEKSVVVKITDFRPFIFLELDSTIKWSLVNQEILKNYLRGILKDNPPKKLEFVETQLAYYYTDAKFMKIHLNTTALIKRLENTFKKPTTIGGLGSNLNFIVHEQKATPLLQICDVQKIIPSGWLKVPNIPSEEEENFSTSDIEIMTSYKNLKFVEKEGFSNPKILSMDLECTSQDISGNTFPYYKNKGDEIICICCTVGKFLDKPDKWKTYALVNAKNNNECNRKAINNIDLDSQKCYRLENFDNEKDLILGYKDLLNEINPDVIVTFNGLSFDEKYMYKRAKLNMCWQKFSKMGKLIDKPARHEKMKWHSQAYGDQEFNYLNIPGRLHIDMYPVISKEYNNLMSYNLDYLSEYFLGDHKDDLPAPEMIRLYHQGGHMERIVKYCNKDAFLPFKLIQNNRLNSWVGLMEMTNITYVQMFDLIIRGQQLKMFSQVYIKCHELGLVVDSKWSHYKPKESEKGIVGATVQNPKKGLWDLVPTLDFSSLYPSTIIAHNICFSTWIPPWKTVPKEHYNEVPCSEHRMCCHDKTIRKTKLKKDKLICRDNIYKYYKPEIKKGIVPMILENLIANRNKAKKKIGEYAALLKIETDPQKRKELEEKISQQDKRQLGLKISANSIYGGFSSEYSYTPFFQGGSTTTAVGRTSIDAAINFITKTVPDAVIVYGDTDSSLIHFKTCKTMEECYERAKKLVEEVNKLFPPPMKMELEKIYWRYFLLSKKRYIGYKIDKDGNVIEKDKKGIVTKRRDGCEFLRDVYNKLIDLVMVKTPKTELYKYLAVKLQELLNHQVPIEKLTMVKSIKDNYKAKNLPHLVVANKMKTRGKYVVSGTRIQYVFIETLEKRAPQYKRVEDPDHVKENKEIKLDYLYYLEKQLAKPIDELFSVAYKTDNILLHLTKLLKINATTDILGYFNPKFRIEEE